MSDRILLTGATGYVGGRLLGRLRERDESVRCLARRPDWLRARIGDDVEVVPGDLLRPETLPAAMAGVGTAYYLVHSMGTGEDFRERDRTAAMNFVTAAREAGVRRIVYLGGLGGEGSLSDHLESRQETGRILREGGVPTLELRASIVIGSGSLSFDLIRALVEKLPVMILPRWTRSLAQPIAIEDVLDYLVRSLDVPLPGSRVVEIGGADRVSYRDLMAEYARQRRLRRLMIRVPVLSPRLSSLWLGLVTPVYANVGRELIEGVRNDTVVTDPAADELFGIRPRGIAEAIERALLNEDREIAETRWADALSPRDAEERYGGAVFGRRRIDSREIRVDVPPADAFRPIRRIGGRTGWYWGNALWRIRGFMDLLTGGVGLRRGRRDPERVVPGDLLDFWRVEAVEPDRLLRLFAEMKLPGRAWLQFEVEPDGDGARIRQTAIFDPIGLSGLAYWYGIWPLHAFVFRGMLRGIARAAGRRAAGKP